MNNSRLFTLEWESDILDFLSAVLYAKRQQNIAFRFWGDNDFQPENFYV